MQDDTAARFLTGAETIPVSVITGFLGSGKTTLLNQLLREPGGMGECAVLVNELGEVGIDHLMVQELRENVVLLASGCLCCAVRGDLIDALRALFLDRLRGTVPAFRRVVIETTGFADPVPVVHTLMTDPLLLERYRLDGMVTTVDAVLGEGQLDAHAEAVKQAVVADRIVLTKLDLTDVAAPDRLRARLKALNPGATVLSGQAASAAALFDIGPFAPETKGRDLLRWLDEAARNAGDGHDHGDHAHHHHHHDDAPAIRTLAIFAERPLRWDAFSEWLGALLAEHGPAVLRTKGLLDLVGQTRPVIVNGVQHVFHPAIELDAWPDADRRSRLVFILRDLDPTAVAARFHARFGAAAA
jgi:G3E family GTPase